MAFTRFIPVSDSLKESSAGYAETIDMSDEEKPFLTSSILVVTLHMML